MTSLRLIFPLVLSLALSACGSWEVGDRPANALYCDNFLLYALCARDMDGDGIVEFVYFEETEKVFMWRDGARDSVPEEMALHQCARPMEDDLAATTSRVFYVDDDTNILEKTDIRGAMMIKYIAYLPGITACNMEADNKEAEASGDS